MVELQRITCKCCGEPLDISKAIGGVIKCAICDSVFVVAKKETSPKALSFLHIGESSLDTCKFDEAYTAYKKASELDPNEPEAYFGMALAEFKVQYLKDVSGEKPRLQPICHEVTDKKFSDNPNYMRAYMKATAEQRSEYERKAQEIDYILGEFYKLKQSGVNYDCFICVKVTDDKTKLRTADYKDADDIYFSLRGKGYKPFFSERELGDVTGADYEARILYALYTSECMLVVCRDESYLQTPWVKNEYTRFLKLVNDEEKESDSITIAFNGKPIERLPGRKGKLQGIDLSKLGALSKIEEFVENHTPEARKKREEAATAKSREAEEQKKRLAQMVEQQAQQQKAFEEQKRLLEEQQRRQHEELEAQKRLLEEQQRRQQEEFEKQQKLLKKQLDEMQKASAATSAAPSVSAGTLSDDELFERMERARLERERKAKAEEERKAREKAEAERKAKEDAERIAREKVEAERKAKEEAERKAKEEAERKAKEEAKRIERAEAARERRALKKAEEELNAIEAEQRRAREWAEAEHARRERLFDVWENSPTIDCYNESEFKLDYYYDGWGNYHKVKDCLIKYNGKKANVKIPKGVIYIYKEAFSRCETITNVTLPDTVTNIGEYAFVHCKNLTDVVIPNSVTKIGYNAFQDCESLKSITIPNSVKEIGSRVFSNCKALTSIVIPDGVKIIEGLFYRCEKLVNVTIPNSVKEIVGQAFCGCESLKSIAIPNGVVSIGYGAFSGCKSLTGITIPNGVTEIGEEAFSNCIGLKSITIPDGVTEIGENAFNGCDNLLSVTIPKKFKWHLAKIFGKDLKKTVQFTFTK